MNKKIAISLLGVALTVTQIGCNKDNDKWTLIRPNTKWGTTEINNTFVAGVCLNKKASEGPNGPSAPYINQTWADEFNGPEVGEDPACYSDDSIAICTQALDWWGHTHADCGGEDLSHLKKLNKCTWSLWKGYSVLENSGKKSYDFQSIQMRYDAKAGSGVLALKVRTNPNADLSKCNNSTKNPECPIMMGGVDSNYRNSMVPGKSVTLGRLEIRAKTPSKVTGGYPALWTWVNNGQQFSYAGEIDLLENPRDNPDPHTTATQHYHTWGANNAHSSKGFTTITNDGEYHRYGVEKLSDRIKFYVDDCYTGEIVNGDMGTGSDRTPLPVDAQTVYAIMNMGTNADVTNNPQKWAGANGQEMLIDYVKVFE